MGLIFNNEQIDLSRFDDEYSKLASETDTDRDRVPDGYYQTHVEEVRLSTTPTTGNPMLVWRLRIEGPTNYGDSITKTRVITPKTLAHVRRDLESFGIRLDRFSDLPRHLPEMDRRQMMVLKKAGANGWTDVYFVRGRAAGAAPSDDEGQNFPAGDDLPF